MNPARRIVFVPDDYRKDVDLGWERDGQVELDTGKHPSGPGQVWPLGDEEEPTRPNWRS